MDNTYISMEVVPGKFSDNKDVTVKLESELSFDEACVKQEVKEEALEDVEPGSPNYAVFPNYIKYEFAGTSQSVYCDSCWTYCKDAEEMKEHQETSPGCQQHKNSKMRVSEDIPNESCKIRVLQTSGGTADVERSTDAILGAKMDSTDISMQVVTKEFVEIEGLTIKIKSELSSVAVFDETDVKQEVKEEPLEHVEPGNPNYAEFHNYIKYEFAGGTSQSVYCDTCWTYCKNVEALKEHQESSPDCKQYKNTKLSVVEDLPDESCKIHVLKTPGVTADVERSTGAISRGCQSDPASDMKSFVEPLEIDTNIKSSSGNKHSICKKRISQNRNINGLNLKHTSEVPFACDVCNQTFIQKGHLNRHKLKHTGERPFACDVCNQTFIQKGHLNRHKLKHTGERPFACDVCNQTFTLKSNLNIHKLKHTGERPFVCDVCNQTFIRKAHLKTHKLIHTGERRFACNVCNQTFTLKSTLNTHKLKHTGERPFACEVCNQTFIQKSSLNTHNLKHTGERPFACDLCNQTFIQKSSLNAHNLKHTGERPFACEVCNQTFIQKSNLKTHKLKHTGERPFTCDM